MATALDICNVALARVGATRISNFENESTREAEVARDLYDEARKALLNAHTWNFAIKRAQLEASDTEPDSGYDYAYPLPDDFIRMIAVHPSDADTGIVEYRLEFQESDDRVLLTNSNQVYIRYVWDIDDPNLMSALFRDALSWRLARDFAAALSKSTAAAQLAEEQYRHTLKQAKAVDGVEDYPDKMQDGSWITSRYPGRDDGFGNTFG